jgi:hypothetical protein
MPVLGAVIKGGGMSISIPARQLPQAGQILVSVVLRWDPPHDAATGSTQLVIPIDQPPQCAAAAGARCIDVQVLHDRFPTSKFLVSTFGFADDGQQLKYELGSLSAGPGSRRRPVAIGQQQSVEVTGLPVGNSTLYACAVDDAGSELCHYQAVTVTQPAAGFDASAVLAGFNLSSTVAATPEALAASSQLLASLVAAAASASRGSDAARNTGEASNLANLPPEVQQAIAAEASQLVALLADGLSLRDNDGTQQLLASVATVASAAGELLSPEARAGLLQVAQQSELGWAANKRCLHPCACSSSSSSSHCTPI